MSGDFVITVIFMVQRKWYNLRLLLPIFYTPGVVVRNVTETELLQWIYLSAE